MSLKPVQAMSSQPSATPLSLLGLLLRVNALQAWRRLKALREQSLLLTGVIALFIVGYITVSFGLFYWGLRFLGRFPGLGEILTERLLFLMFAFLFILLLFSNIVIGYTNLFRNRETEFLWTVPVPARTILRYKFLETSLLASWAFLFLIAPFLVAYGLHHGAPWHFYGLTLLQVSLFIVLPTVIGCWVAISLARHMDRRSFQVAAVVVALVALVVAAVWMKPELVGEDIDDTRVLGLMDRLLARTAFAHYPLLPSYWLSSSTMYWVEGSLGAAVFFLMVLLSYALFLGLLAFTSFGGIFYDAASAVQSRGSVFGQWEWFRKWQDARRRFTWPRGAAERVVGCLWFVRPDVRALVVKDMRMFWRDTTQWGQTLMLFGLLGVYIINLRHFSHQIVSPFWVNLISFLNLGACSLNLATVTTRFVYPQFSLEGKRLWVIGMAPLGLVRVVRAKFWLATVVSLMVTGGLIWLSCHLLRLSAERTLYFTGAVIVMTLALNGLSVGLGTLYPNLKEDNPSKIVSGFGGTLCLVLSFLYIVASVVLLAIGSPWGMFRAAPPGSVLAGSSTFLALSLLVGWLPYQLGLRKAANLQI
jgi:ABC-2 type transport system permease protein